MFWTLVSLFAAGEQLVIIRFSLMPPFTLPPLVSGMSIPFKRFVNIYEDFLVLLTFVENPLLKSPLIFFSAVSNIFIHFFFYASEDAAGLADVSLNLPPSHTQLSLPVLNFSEFYCVLYFLPSTFFFFLFFYHLLAWKFTLLI